MTEEIKDILKRYDEIGALILEQKLDEFGLPEVQANTLIYVVHTVEFALFRCLFG